MAKLGHTALGTWSGGRFMHFGAPVDDDRYLALIRPDERVRTVLTADVYGEGAADRLLGAALEGPFLSPQRAGVHAPQHLRAPAVDELRTLLAKHRGNIAAVGRALGVARMQVHRWLERYEITIDDYRRED